MLAVLSVALSLAPGGRRVARRAPIAAIRMGAGEPQAATRNLGQMERLLNARRSWSGVMTTAHVSAAVLEGPPPTESELL